MLVRGIEKLLLSVFFFAVAVTYLNLDDGFVILSFRQKLFTKEVLYNIFCVAFEQNQS